MINEITQSMNKGFEEIKHIDENGVEYWYARELFILMGYARWEGFESLIKRAELSCKNSGQIIENHFRHLTKMVEIGSNTKRKIDDYKLDRYACYLIAQNGDPKIVNIALAQTYFAIQTRKQEIFDTLSDKEKRIYIRNEVKNENLKLFKTAKASGVNNFGLFYDAGYRGLYGMPASEIEKRKNIKKGELLDRAGSTELAANLFRITQTDDKLKKDNISTEREANRVHNMVGGKVRQTIKDIGGVLPENMKTEIHIKEIEKEIKKIDKAKKKLK